MLNCYKLAASLLLYDAETDGTIEPVFAARLEGPPHYVLS